MGLTFRLGQLPTSLFTDASNNVGIGGSPSGSYKLEVTGTGRFSGELSTTSGLLSISGAGGGPPTGGVGFRFVSNRLIVYGGSSDITFQKNSNAGANMTILESGNVGIGTSSPSEKLHIYGTGTNTQALLLESSISSGNAYATFKNPSKFYITGLSADIGPNSYIIYDATASAARLIIASDGRTTIRGGTSDSTAFTLVCENSSQQNLFYLRNDGLISTGTRANSPYNNTTGSGANAIFASDGTLQRSTSSLKYKTDVRNYDKGLAEVMSMRPVYYKGKNDGDIQFAGLIAEEIHNLGLTEFVQYAEDGTPDALSYANMIALLTKAIQEMNQQNQDLKSRLDKAGL